MLGIIFGILMFGLGYTLATTLITTHLLDINRIVRHEADWYFKFCNIKEMLNLWINSD